MVARGGFWAILLSRARRSGLIITAAAATAVGWLMGHIFPFRAGILVRAGVVARQARIPLPTIAASLALERGFDLAVTAILAIASTILVGWAVGGPFMPLVGLSVALLVGMGAVGALALRSPEHLARVAPRQWRPRVVEGLVTFRSGVRELAADRRRLAKALAWAALVAAFQMVCLAALVSAFLPGLAIETLVVSVPWLALSFYLAFTPSNLGTFEGAFAAIYVPLGIPLERALAAAVLMHSAMVALALVVGGGAWVMVSARARPPTPTEAGAAAPLRQDAPPKGLRILLVGNTDHSMVHFRSALLRRLVDGGYDVYVAVPDGPFVPALQALGVKVVVWRLARRSTNPFREIRSLVHLAVIHRRVRPDIAHYFSLKPALYGPFAARSSGVPHAIVSITGLGYVFTGAELHARLLRHVVVPMCRLSFSLCDQVLFQNDEDHATIDARGGLPKGRGIVMRGGEGVDAAHFDPAKVSPGSVDALRAELRSKEGELIVLLVARVLGHKGVREYVEAARMLRGRARFLIVGPIDEENPSAIPHEEILSWESEGVIMHLGERQDIRELLALADVAVLPSYREGTSQFLLEACAMAVPTVATDVPGCRVVVEHGNNGLLVPPRDGAGLAKAIQELLEAPALRARMGVAAREKALAMFDVHRVVDRVMDVYERAARGEYR